MFNYLNYWIFKKTRKKINRKRKERTETWTCQQQN